MCRVLLCIDRSEHAVRSLQEVYQRADNNPFDLGRCKPLAASVAVAAISNQRVLDVIAVTAAALDCMTGGKAITVAVEQ